jgi:hypothetical protein
MSDCPWLLSLQPEFANSAWQTRIEMNKCEQTAEAAFVL